MEEVVVDTNVAVVANGRTPQARAACVKQCIQELRRIQRDADRRILLDEGGLILNEYRRQLNPSGQPGSGDAFYQWLRDNQWIDRHCRKIQITPHDDHGFEEFPSDPALAGFDRNDRKFVAVAVASRQSPPILNASDTDWWDHHMALNRNGIEVTFLCPELMNAHNRKVQL